MALANMERPQPKGNEHAHVKDEQESTGLDAMQKNKDLATLSTGSHATKDAVNNVLTTVSFGKQRGVKTTLTH